MNNASVGVFSVWMATGTVFGWIWAWLRVYRRNPHRYSYRQLESYLDFMSVSCLCLLVGGLAGGRLGYVFLHWSYYQEHTSEILAFSAGGLDWIGSLPGAAILLFLCCGIWNKSPYPLLEDLFHFFFLLMLTFWLAATSAGIYYGPIHTPAWWTMQVTDQLSEVNARIPLNLLAVVYTLLTGGWIDLYAPLRLRRYKFEFLAMFQMALCMALSFFRADPVAPLLGIPSDRLFSIGYFFFFLLLYWVRTGCLPGRKESA